MRLHVANLSPKITEPELRRVFGQFGEVLGVELTWRRSAGRTSGTAIVEMNPVQGLAAARALNQQPLRHRRLYITLMGGEPRKTAPTAPLKRDK